MFKPDIINFTLEDVKGNLSLEQGILGQPKVYQDGQLLKKQGIFKAKYPVVTNNGQGDMMELRRGLSFAYSVIFRGKETRLEENLSRLEYVLGILPLLLLVSTGGFIGAIIGLIGVTFVCNFVRTEKRVILQIIVAVCTMLVCWLFYLLIALLLGILVYS